MISKLKKKHLQTNYDDIIIVSDTFQRDRELLLISDMISKLKKSTYRPIMMTSSPSQTCSKGTENYIFLVNHCVICYLAAFAVADLPCHIDDGKKNELFVTMTLSIYKQQYKSKFSLTILQLL